MKKLKQAPRAALWAALWLLAITAGGCQSALCTLHPDGDAICESDEYSSTLGDITAAEPTAVEGGVIWRVSALDRLTLVATQGGSAEVVHIDLPGEPSRLVARPTGDDASPSKDVLVLSQEDGSLTLVDTTARTLRRFPLGSPFTDLALSPDGRYAIAWFAPGQSSNSIVQNISEIAIVDLDALPAEDSNPQPVTLRTFAARPFAINFAPAFQIRGQERRVALILSNNSATLLELDNPNPEDPNVNETVVHFTRDESQTITPHKVVWSIGEDAEDADTFAFLLASGSDDVISLNLLPGETLDAQSRPKLRPSLNQLSAGRAPSDLVAYTLRGQRKLLTVNPSSADLAVIDVATGDTRLIPVEGVFASVIVFQAINDDTQVEEPRAMLYLGNGSSRAVAFVDLASIEARGTRAINNRSLTAGIEEMTVAVHDGRPRAIIRHRGASGFSILDLERESAAALEITRPLEDFVVAEEQDTILSTYEGSTSISLTSLKSAQSLIVELDRQGDRMFYIPERNSIVVTHPNSDLGSITVLPFTAPTRANATSLVGFAAWDVLGQDEE